MENLITFLVRDCLILLIKIKQIGSKWTRTLLVYDKSFRIRQFIVLHFEEDIYSWMCCKFSFRMTILKEKVTKLYLCEKCLVFIARIDFFNGKLSSCFKLDCLPNHRETSFADYPFFNKTLDEILFDRFIIL